MKSLILAFAKFIFWFFFIPCNSYADTGVVVLPNISDKPLKLRVVYFENPRFTKLNQSEIQKVLSSAKQLVLDHFGLNVVFPDQISIRDIQHEFEKLNAQTPPQFNKLIGDFRNNNVNWDIIKKNLIEDIQSQDASLNEQISFAEPHLISPVEKDNINSFADAIIEVFKKRLNYWTHATLKDGYPVIGKTPTLPDLFFNEYGYWALMAKLGIEEDVILTNQLIASVEYMPIPIHTSIRGGITGGSTEFNPSSKYGSSVWISLFPYLSNDPAIIKLRNGDIYSRDQALLYAGAMVAHEMGHQLLHLGHPWANEACVMRPAEILDFKGWLEKLDSSQCKLNSSAEMTPGNIKIPIW